MCYLNKDQRVTSFAICVMLFQIRWIKGGVGHADWGMGDGLNEEGVGIDRDKL